jgi:hypothetical protein
MIRRLRLAPATAIVAVVVAIALYSAWHSGGHVWRRLSADRRTYAAYTSVERRQAPVNSVGLPGDIFDFYTAHLLPGDRFYLQVKPGGYGQFFDLPQLVAALGRFYFLPAVQVADVRHATVVISYYANPADLHVHFPTQVEAGLQPIYVSRISAP